jgi:hypothetical protein
MGVNMYPFYYFLGQNKDANIREIFIDELIKKDDDFVRVFLGAQHLNFEHKYSNLQAFYHHSYDLMISFIAYKIY